MTKDVWFLPSFCIDFVTFSVPLVLCTPFAQLFNNFCFARLHLCDCCSRVTSLLYIWEKGTFPLKMDPVTAQPFVSRVHVSFLYSYWGLVNSTCLLGSASGRSNLLQWQVAGVSQSAEFFPSMRKRWFCGLEIKIVGMGVDPEGTGLS